jgi:uncharacterized protein
MNVASRYELLKQNLAKKGSIIIAFSGGVDSSLLAVLATEILQDKCRCILLESQMVPRRAVNEAECIADTYGLVLEILPVTVMDDIRFKKNPVNRCYICKKNSSKVLKRRAEELGFACIADGINVTDTGEHRPGLLAGNEEGIIHPFIEAGITKEDIREIARRRSFSFWDKPSAACLSSWIPYGDEITREKLIMIESAEDFLHKSGLREVRVRTYGTVARIEIMKEDMQALLSVQEEVAKSLKAIGFSYITVDLEGYRSGSMDEILRQNRIVP